MSARIWGVVVLLVASVLSAEADPVHYTVSGRLFDRTANTYLDLSGSFTLSDPSGTIFDAFGGAESWQYGMTNLVLGTGSLTFTGAGAAGTLRLRDGYPTDSFFALSFGGGGYSFLPTYNNVTFGGVGCGSAYAANCYAAQPDVVSFLMTDSGQILRRADLSVPYTLTAMTAQRVPEPTTLAFVGLGLTGLMLMRRRPALARRRARR